MKNDRKRHKKSLGTKLRGRVIRVGLAAYGGYVVIVREKWLASFSGVTTGVAV